LCACSLRAPTSGGPSRRSARHLPHRLAMLFVLSSAARFHAKPAADCVLRSTPRLQQKTRGLVAELKRLEAKDIKKQLHVNDALAKQYAQSLSNFEKEKPVTACNLYDSPFWNGFDAASFEQDDADWANDYVRVFSGLYGLLRPFDEIQPLSLPVVLGTKLKNSKGNFLRDYWREPITKELNDGLKHLPMPVIVNLASEEDSQVLDLDALPEYTHMTTIDFKMVKKGDVAEAKGEFLRWALENRCMTVEDLLEFRGLIEEDEEATFRLSPKASKGNTIVFEENIGEGGDGGWSKKLAESGKGKTAFLKEVIKGKKNKYMKSEINKAFAKESKQKRKAHAVY